MELSDSIIKFLEKQGSVIVATVNPQGKIHCAVKGIAGIEKEGKVFIIDLYSNRTFNNLKRDPRASITAVDEHRFRGYTLQGTARVVSHAEIADHIVAAWENKIIRRISNRLIKGVQSQSQSPGQFEAELPSRPEHLIVVDVDEIIDLSPSAVQE